jgi:hypothetical protein
MGEDALGESVTYQGFRFGQVLEVAVEVHEEVGHAYL